tara:strand:- start:17396 stop:18703 length:1308 start_codon:yes stop_codon:yes gene_type:complete
MNLQDIRQYIANIIDYDPSTNREYTEQIENVINHHYRMLFAEKAFSFAQKEVKLEIYTDATRTASGTYSGSLKLTIVDATSDLPAWIEGNIVEIEGTEYEVLYRDPTVLTRFFIDASMAVFSAKTITFKQRFIRLPQDCVSLLQVGRRSASISPSAVGRFIPLTRYEDEYYNLPLDEVNIPNYWIIQDSISMRTPTRPPTISANATTAGQGVRKVRVAQTYVKWDSNGQKYEMESGLSSFSDEIELSDTQQLRINIPVLASRIPFARRIYIYNANNIQDFKGVYQVDKVAVGGGGNVDIDFTQESFEDGTFILDTERYSYFDGYAQRLRLYPRQSEDFELSVRYIYRPPRLQENTDTPELPQSHHLILAYACLMDVLNKHDNPTLAGIYRRKYERELVKMEQRFLTQKPRRFVKGFMKESGVDTVPMFTPLRRIP